MKVRINTYVNLRTELAEIHPYNNPGDVYFSPGDIINVAETVVGENYKGNNLWYRLEEGGYVWSGGACPNIDYKLNSNSSHRNDLSQKILLSQSINGNGKNITIGILDSGIDTLTLKTAQIVQEQNNLQLLNPHGTMVAGIIVGDDADILGLAVDSSLIGFKVIDDDGNVDNYAIFNTLKTIESENIEVDILNMSLDIIKAYQDDIQKLIDKLSSKGVVVVVAGFDGGNLNLIATLNNVIPVGVFEKSEFLHFRNDGFPLKDSICFLNTPIYTTSLNSHPNRHGNFLNSSAYTAVVSGLIAKLLSSKNISKTDRLQEVRKCLTDYAFNLKHEDSPVQFKLYNYET